MPSESLCANYHTLPLSEQPLASLCKSNQLREAFHEKYVAQIWGGLDQTKSFEALFFASKLPQNYLKTASKLLVWSRPPPIFKPPDLS